MKTKRIVLMLAVLVVFAVAMTSCAFLSQYHEHVWEGGSCTEPRTCSVCHAVEEEVLGHAEESVLGYAATCTEEGLSNGTVCSICGTVVVAQEVIPALGHDIVVDEAIDADCLNSGLTAGEHCSRCDGATVAQETIPALGHDIVKDAAKAPTCSETGLTAGEHCTKCDYNIAQETVPTLSHTEQIVAGKAATCTEAGLTEGKKCSVCGEVILAQETVPALGHDIVKDAAKAPTCTESGLTEGEHCTRCDGATIAQQTVAALGHKYENCACTVCQAVIPALSVTDSFDFTTADGLNAALASGKLGYTGTFRDNGDSHQFAANSSIQFVVPANTTVTITGHSTGYGVFDVYLNGVKTDMAGVLSFTVTEETKVVILPDEEATYSKAYLKSIALEKFVDRTIVEDTTITFGSEGNYKDSIVDFSGIQIGDNGGNNSQVKNGSFDLLLKAGSKVVIHGYPKYTSYKLNDGEEITAEWYTYIALTDTVLTVTPVNGNNFFYSIEITLHKGIELVAAKDSTCSVAGNEEYYTCSCHGELTEKVARELLAHTEETVVGKAATCTETGLTNGKKCSACGAILEAQQLIPAAGHKDDDNDYKCDVCKADLCTEHVAGEAVEENRTEATCTAAGSYDSVVKCQHCHEELSRETISIPMLSHTEEKVLGKDATCTVTGLTEGKKCSVCGTTLVAQEEIPMIAHTEELVPGKAATCESTGLTEGKKCSVCGETLVAQEEIAAKGHAYETIYVWAADNSYYIEKQICKNDASHVVDGATVTVSHIDLHVTASKVTFTYHAGEQTKVVESDLALENNIATINAPAVEGRVASHDYVKFGFHDAAATYEFTIYYSEVDVWDGTVATKFAGGTGTEEDPYIIMTGAQLAYLAKLGMDNTAAKDSVYGTGVYYKLGASLDLSNHQWIPIAMYDTSYQWTYFNGNFDGANHKIVINIDNASLGYGLFSGLGAKSVVKNLILCGSVTVDNRAGALAYITQAGATVENVTNYANVTGTSASAGYIGGLFGATQGAIINNCVNYGTIAGNYCFNGGIVGQALSNSKITSCTNFGYIGGNGFQSGGIVGSNKPSQIEKCYNYGTITGLKELGGISGYSSVEISGCANYGQIVGSSCTSTGLAQITPSDITKTDCVEGGSVVIPDHTLTSVDAKAATCEADGNVAYDYCSNCKKNYDTDGKEIANVVIDKKGHSYDDGVTENGVTTFTCGNCGDSYTQSSKYTVTVNYVDLDGTKVAEPEAIEFAYGEIATINAKTIDNLVPSHDYVKIHVLDNATVTIYYSPVDVWDGVSVSESLQGSGTAEDPYLIQSAADLAYVAQTVNALAGNKVGFTGVYMRLTKSIDLNGADFRIGVYVSGGRKGFGAYLDGNNCSIRGLNNTDALIGSLESAGYVKNLSIYGVVSKDDAYVGGLCSILYNKAIIENVTSYVTVSGRGAVAGIAGKAYAGTTVKNCVNYGDVNASTWQSGGITGCSLGDVDGCINFGAIFTEGTDVGGIAGYSKDGNSGKGTTSNCYNYGNVTSNGEAGKVGGISGYGNIVNNCYNYGTVSAPNVTSTYVGGIYGYVYTSSEGCVDYSGFGK